MALFTVISITKRILMKQLSTRYGVKAVNSVELPPEIVDRFNYTYPYSDATRRTAKSPLVN